MKISLRFIFAALAATAALTACTKEPTPPNFENDKVNPATEGSRVIAVSFAPQTKTYLDEGLQPKFVNEKDTILLYTVPEDENESLLTDTCVVAVDENSNATISTDLSGKLKAVYPAQATVLEDNIITAEIPAIQSGRFADANIAVADIDENNSAQFENVAPLLIITPPSSTKKLIVKSLKTIGEDGQRSEMACPINTSDEEKEQCTVTVLNPDNDGRYYVTLYFDYEVKLSNLSFEAWFDEGGATGSIKGIPEKKIVEQAAATGIGDYEIIQPGVAYTIDENNWHEYVTVAGRKWATMNIGAESAEAYGRHFAWGDITGQEADLSIETLDAVKANAFNPGFSVAPTLDPANPPVLPLKYDAANANWGGAWRIPTMEEFGDLIESESGDFDAGRYFGVSPNQIYLPAAGGGEDKNLAYMDVMGNYLSSTLNTTQQGNFNGLCFYSELVIIQDEYPRSWGLSIRAIIDDPDAVTPAPEEVATDLSSSETANCYIVNAAGVYKFKAVKGNSNESVGTPKSAEVLWESYGTSTAPNVKDLVSKVSLENGYVKFTATDKKGNAVIAVKDENKNIIWSWHIWLTDEPEDQVYANDAGTMMDRNLGATSNNGSDEANKLASFGLLYQWGRKDPFLGGDGVKSTTRAASTLSWPEAEGGHKTVDWAIQNPTTFITSSENPLDWTNPRNDELWKSDKTIYDPCPSGYRVPDGGDGGVWKTAGFSNETRGKFVDGFNFSTLSGGGTTWYPAANRRSRENGTLSQWPTGNYWSCSSNDAMQADLLYFREVEVNSVNSFGRACGISVRCQKIVEE